jgi:hypothetical protein
MTDQLTSVVPRQAGPRDKLWAFVPGIGVLLLSLFVAHWFHHWSIDSTDSSAFPRVNVDRFKAVWILGASIILGAGVLAAGISGIKRAFGHALDQLRIWLRFEAKAYLRLSHRLMATPRVSGTGNFIAAGLAILVGAAWVLLFLAVHQTGGIVRSPFLQFAASMFVWELLLSDSLPTRGAVALTAVAFVVLCIFRQPAAASQSIRFSLGYVVLITFLNLLFQCLPLVFAKEHQNE